MNPELYHEVPARVLNDRTISPLNSILGTVAFHTGLSTSMLLGPCRSKPYYRARWACWWVAMAMGRYNPYGLAQWWCRDHTTIAHGLGRADELRVKDPAFRRLTDRTLAAMRQMELTRG